MKILHLCTSDYEGGAARAAYRLHQGLRQIGQDSEMLVYFKTRRDASVLAAYPTAGKLEQQSIRLGPYMNRRILRRSPRKAESGYWSANRFPSVMPRIINRIAPDIVHLHWIGDGFLPIPALKHIEAPLVWTLHDSWPFTGGCHLPDLCRRYTESCGHCPQLLHPGENDLSRTIWREKQREWQELNLTIITPSQWLAGCAKDSSLFRSRRIDVIPNGVNLRLYRPLDKPFSRAALNLPTDKRLAMFGAVNSAADHNKGFDLLQAALRQLAAGGWNDRLELVIFGADAPQNPPDFGLKCHYLGTIRDEITMPLVYSAADVFVAPSRQENLPNTILEALACGTPCAAFHIGGMPDMIDHRENGYLAEPYSPADLARGIVWGIEQNHDLRLSAAARLKMEKYFEHEAVSRRILALYQELTG